MTKTGTKRFPGTFPWSWNGIKDSEALSEKLELEESSLHLSQQLTSVVLYDPSLCFVFYHEYNLLKG